MDTIAAISTSTGQGGIGIIRMSGEHCFDILDRIFVPKNNDKIKGYNIKYGHIKNINNEIIDEVLVSYFIKPKSYTTENMCEINTHGGYTVERAILQKCLENGAVLAGPGEFTKRAFLNGRIDLSQAEAVVDIINSKTQQEMKVAEKQLEGNLSKKIKEIQSILLDTMAYIEASIDYPEYDVEEKTNEEIYIALNKAEDKLKKLKESYKSGKIIKEGIKTAIIGKPNVGKSSILNLILNEDRAIVSNIEGTTRDTIEEDINIKGIPLKIIDTAGIRKTNDEIEKIGVKKSINIINQADLIFAVFDDSREFNKEDKDVLSLIENKNAIVIINKADLKKNKLPVNEKIFNNKKTIRLSTKTEEGLDELYNTIVEMFNINKIDTNNGEIVTNMRQEQHITNALKHIKEAYKAIKENMPVDIISINIKDILEELGNITGENASEDIINEIFSKFCLGK